MNLCVGVREKRVYRVLGRSLQARQFCRMSIGSPCNSWVRNLENSKSYASFAFDPHASFLSFFCVVLFHTRRDEGHLPGSNFIIHPLKPHSTSNQYDPASTYVCHQIFFFLALFANSNQLKIVVRLKKNRQKQYVRKHLIQPARAITPMRFTLLVYGPRPIMCLPIC